MASLAPMQVMISAAGSSSTPYRSIMNLAAAARKAGTPSSKG